MTFLINHLLAHPTNYEFSPLLCSASSDFFPGIPPDASREARSERIPPSKSNFRHSYHDEKAAENTEIARLHNLWSGGLGRLLIEEDVTLPDLIQHLSMGEPIIAVGGLFVFDSPRWGRIDLNRLNQAREAYPTNLGQVQLFRDLAIVLNRPRLGIGNTKKHWGKEAGAIYKRNQWNNIPLSWKEYLWYHQGIDWFVYRNDPGYTKFAIDHFQGSSQEAWQVASSLLTDDEFAALNWGKAKFTNVAEEEGFRTTLHAGLKDGTLTREAGYTKFAADHFQGSSQKAWMVASSLLTDDEFAALNWGKQKQTNIAEEEGFRTTLHAGLKDGTLTREAGYTKFATDHFQGDSHKAWKVASSLLTDNEFTALNWGKRKAGRINGF